MAVRSRSTAKGAGTFETVVEDARAHIGAGRRLQFERVDKRAAGFVILHTPSSAESWRWRTSAAWFHDPMTSGSAGATDCNCQVKKSTVREWNRLCGLTKTRLRRSAPSAEAAGSRSGSWAVQPPRGGTGQLNSGPRARAQDASISAPIRRGLTGHSSLTSRYPIKVIRMCVRRRAPLAITPIRPVTSPRPTRVPSGPGAHAVIVTSSPSSRNVRFPLGSSSGSVPFQVSSSSEPYPDATGPAGARRPGARARACR